MCDFDDGFDGFDWMDIALAGALAEAMAEEEKERKRQSRDTEEYEDP